MPKLSREELSEYAPGKYVSPQEAAASETSGDSWLGKPDNSVMGESPWRSTRDRQARTGQARRWSCWGRPLAAATVAGVELGPLASSAVHESATAVSRSFEGQLRR